MDDVPIPVHFGDVYVPYSFEVGMDARNFLEELTRVMSDAADHSRRLRTPPDPGPGSPRASLPGWRARRVEINTTGSEALVAADAYALQNALPPRFQANARWVANIATINTFAQFETTNGALKFPEIANDRLLRKPLHELSNMDGAINAAATANNYVLLIGQPNRRRRGSLREPPNAGRVGFPQHPQPSPDAGGAVASLDDRLGEPEFW